VIGWDACYNIIIAFLGGQWLRGAERSGIESESASRVQVPLH